MLTRTEKKVLYACSKCVDPLITTTAIQQHVSNVDKYEIIRCCEHLANAGYFEEFCVDLSGEVRLFLTYKGHHYREISWLELKEFLFKSISVPIFVSVVTSLITLWLQGLL